jgi:hypothetical protein
VKRISTLSDKDAGFLNVTVGGTCASSCPMALQPNLDPGLQTSSILAFEHPHSIAVLCIYPSSSGPYNWFSLFSVSFESFLRYPLVHPHHVTHLLESPYSDILGLVHMLTARIYPRRVSPITAACRQATGWRHIYVQQLRIAWKIGCG